MNKRFAKIFVGLFLAVIAFPFAGSFFYKTDFAVEKKTPVPFPDLIGQDDGKLNIHYLSDLGDYFTERFAFRQEMTTLDAELSAALTDTSVKDQVVYGKDGWLYYFETLDEYFGRNTLSERGINNCVKNLKLINDYCDAKGVKFVFSMPSIKADLYPSHMPFNYIKGSGNNREKLKAGLDKSAVSYVDLHEAFTNDSRVMYHKLDSHWNNEGAAFAAKLLQDSVGGESIDYKNEEYEVKKDFRGDIYGMLFPKGSELDDNVYYKRRHIFEYVSGTGSSEDFDFETKAEGREGSLVMFRDSYGNALAPFMADYYSKAYFTQCMPYDLSYADEYEADTVMVELTQRHINYLRDYLPVMDAPLREDIALDIKSYDDMACRINVVNDEDNDDYVLIYGEVDPDYTDPDSDIVVRLEDSESIADYEAFAACYDSKDKSEKEKDYSFGLRIAKSEITDGKFNIRILTEKDGNFVSSGVLKETEKAEI